MPPFSSIVTGLVAPQLARAETFRFDLGTESSELRDGFIRITAGALYSNQRGFGWKSNSLMASFTRST